MSKPRREELEREWRDDTNTDASFKQWLIDRIEQLEAGPECPYCEKRKIVVCLHCGAERKIV